MGGRILEGRGLWGVDAQGFFVALDGLRQVRRPIPHRQPSVGVAQDGLHVGPPDLIIKTLTSSEAHASRRQLFLPQAPSVLIVCQSVGETPHDLVILRLNDPLPGGADVGVGSVHHGQGVQVVGAAQAGILLSRQGQVGAGQAFVELRKARAVIRLPPPVQQAGTGRLMVDVAATLAGQHEGEGSHLLNQGVGLLLVLLGKEGQVTGIEPGRKGAHADGVGQVGRGGLQGEVQQSAGSFLIGQATGAQVMQVLEVAQDIITHGAPPRVCSSKLPSCAIWAGLDRARSSRRGISSSATARPRRS